MCRPQRSAPCSSRPTQPGPPPYPGGRPESHTCGPQQTAASPQPQLETRLPPSCCPTRLGPENLQQSSPSTFGIHLLAHLRATRAVACQPAMLQLDQCRSIICWSKSHFHLAALAKIWFVLPVRPDLPRHNKKVRRLPRQYRTPRAVRPILLLCINRAHWFALDHNPLHRRAANMVRPRPPAIHLFGEDAEGPHRVGSH